MRLEDFGIRLAKLREKKNISARDMSFSLDQNAGYISTIESGKSYPSMTAFFNICEFLEISPKDFFDDSNGSPERIKDAVVCLKELPEDQLDSITIVLKSMTK